MIASLKSRLAGTLSLVLALALHAAAFHMLVQEMRRPGAGEIPTAAISINLTHTQILDAVADAPVEIGAATQEAVAPSSDAVPEASERKSEKEAGADPKNARALAAEKAAERKAEEEARAKADAREQAEKEARQRAEEKRRRAAEAEERRREAEEERRRKVSRPSSRSAQSRSASKPQRVASAARVSASAGQMRNYQAKVRAHIARNRPRSMPGRSGVVHVAFGLSEAGGITRIKFLRSSGDAALDKAVASALRRAAPFPRAPKGATSAQRYFDMPFTFN